MTTMTASSLTDLAARLERQLGSASSFGAVSTRVLLRTGVNLRAPKPEQINDRAIVAKVSAVLTEMKYTL
jgi:hypothetical protein